jgi:hypothetical protein
MHAVLSYWTTMSPNLGAAVAAQRISSAFDRITPALAASNSVAGYSGLLVDKSGLTPCVENIERPDLLLERDNP